MVEVWKARIRAWLFRSETDALIRQQSLLDERERHIEQAVNQRVAEVLTKMDPFEPVMRMYRGVFGETFERPEERLDAQSILRLQTLGYTLADDPSFNYLCEWIMNSQGNETLTKAAVTPERILYGRAQISGVLAFRKEVRRLSEAYKDVLDGRKASSFDPNISTD